MEIVIDFVQIGSNPLAFAWWFFKTIGWIIPVLLFIAGLLKFWQLHIRNLYRKKRQYTMLAIDVPRNNEQTPKAVENIFNHLAGAHQPLRFVDKWWFGEVPDSFSLEIVSLDGYIQFIIHLPKQHRDLIEAMIYAQYPDAEITEIEDYTKKWDIRFPNDKYDLWGTELKLAKSHFYPIRTYQEFEDTASKESYKDSMAAILEALTRIGQGEQIWVQLVVTPADNNWGDGAQKIINKIIGAKSEGGNKGIIGGIENTFGYFADSIFSSPSSDAGGQKNNEPPNKILYLTPGEKDVVAAIEAKTAKIGFHTKIRIIYLAEKNRFNKPIANTVYGAFKQFNTNDLNSIKPNGRYLTGGIVYFKTRRLINRKNKILYLYKQRGHWFEPGDYGYTLNTEELATLYHFPTAIVKTPLLQKAEAKKAEPPISLPIRENPEILIPTNEQSETQSNQEAATEKTSAQRSNQQPTTKATPPENLPIG